MSNVGQVASLTGVEHIVRIPSIDLSSRFKKNPGIGNQSGDRETGIVDAILTSHEIVCDNGAIGPGQHVIVKCVHLTEGSSHLSDLDKQPAGDCRKCDVPFLKVYAFLAERKKKVRASIWVDNSLKRGLGLMHLKCRI